MNQPRCVTIQRIRAPDLLKTRSGCYSSSIPPVGGRDSFLSPSPSWQLGVGVMRIERGDPAQESVLQNWLENYVLPEFSNRILPVDLAVGRRCAHLNVSDQCPERDTLIAATGLVHGMTVVTQNTEDFRYSGVTVLGP